MALNASGLGHIRQAAPSRGPIHVEAQTVLILLDAMPRAFVPLRGIVARPALPSCNHERTRERRTLFG